MITGAIYISLMAEPDTEDWTRDRRQLVVLERCPDGARVVVDIGRRQFISQDAAVWLHAHDHRLAIEIIGTEPTVVHRFIQAARAGEWSAIA